MRYKILNTIKNYHPKAKSILKKLGKIDYLHPDEKLLKKIIGKYDALLVGLGLNIKKETLKEAKNLKAIATATTGLDHIDVDYAENLGIKILSLRNEEDFLNSLTGTAELAFGLMISLLRQIPFSFEAVKNYKWDRESFRGYALSGKILGIIGFGRLGKMMARYGQAFNMKLLAFDPYVKKEIFRKFNCQKVNFDFLLKQSDIISIHVHLNRETENMFDKKAFSKMKKGAYLINTSRGKIVNENELIKALKSGKIGGYVADVLSDELDFKEKFIKNNLIEYAKKNRNVIIVSHLGGMTYESREATDIFITEKLKRFLLSFYGKGKKY